MDGSDSESWHYGGASDITPGSPSWIPANTNQKEAISTNDANRWTTSLVSTTGFYDYQMYKFKIDEALSEISALTARWKGYGDIGTDFTTSLHIWNGTSWERLAVSLLPSPDGTLGGSRASNLNNYVDENSYVFIMAKAKYNDTPAIPGNFRYESVDNNGGYLRWTANTESDFQKYEIYKSTDNINFNLEFTFTDKAVTQQEVRHENGDYYYKIRAIDIYGKASDFSSTVTKSSCPLLFTWNGDKYEFVTDFLGASVLGYRIGNAYGANMYLPVDNDEYVKIDGSQLKEQDGKLKLNVNEMLQEVTYLDKLELIAVDHHEDEEVVPNEGFNFRKEKLKLISNKNEKIPVKAVDDRNRDILPHLREIDNDYVPFETIDIGGFAKRHSLTLDLGKIDTKNATLLLNGWVEYPDSKSIGKISDVELAKRKGIRIELPSLEVKGKDGKWQKVTSFMGMPAGLSKTFTFPLQDKKGKPIFKTNDRLIRITTNQRIYYDKIWTSSGEATAKLTTLKPVKADLHYFGFSNFLLKDGKEPGEFIYDQKVQGENLASISGYATRYGDVLPLLKERDDKFVIMTAGDETSLEFSADKLPKLKRGYKRDFLLYANGYFKAGRPGRAYGYTIKPLPYENMFSAEGFGFYPYDKVPNPISFALHGTISGKQYGFPVSFKGIMSLAGDYFKRFAGLATTNRYPSSQKFKNYEKAYNTRFIEPSFPQGYADGLNRLNAEKTPSLENELTSSNTTNKTASPSPFAYLIQSNANNIHHSLNTNYVELKVSTGLGSGEVPVAPEDFTGQSPDQYSIRWSWKGNPTAEYYVIHDENDNSVALVEQNPDGSDDYSYLEGGLITNKQYTRYVISINSNGESSPSNSAVVSTLPKNPAVLPGANIYSDNQFEFTNNAGGSGAFGEGHLDHYHWIWDRQKTRTKEEIENSTNPVWDSGKLTTHSDINGQYYLHLVAHNKDHQTSTKISFGPYNFGFTAADISLTLSNKRIYADKYGYIVDGSTVYSNLPLMHGFAKNAYRTYLRFDHGLPKNATVTSATLTLPQTVFTYPTTYPHLCKKADYLYKVPLFDTINAQLWQVAQFTDPVVVAVDEGSPKYTNGTFNNPTLGVLDSVVTSATDGDKAVAFVVKADDETVDPKYPQFNQLYGATYLPPFLTISATVPSYAQVTAPVGGSFVGGTVDVKGTAFAPDITSYKVELLNTETGIKSLLTQAAGAVIKDTLVTFNSIPLADGKYKIELTVNTPTSSLKETGNIFTIDNTPPEADLNELNAEYLSGKIKFTGTVSDQNLKNYKLQHKSETGSWTTFANKTENVENGLLATFNTTTLANGNYQFRVIAADKADAETTSNIIEGEIDNTDEQPYDQANAGWGKSIVTVTIDPVMASIEQINPNTALGNQGKAFVKKSGVDGAAYNTLIRYEVDKYVPKDAVIDKAYLKISNTQTWPALKKTSGTTPPNMTQATDERFGEGSFAVNKVNSGWNETVTWSNKPEVGDELINKDLTPVRGTTTYNFDANQSVTSLTKQWQQNNDTNKGLQLSGYWDLGFAPIYDWYTYKTKNGVSTMLAMDQFSGQIDYDQDNNLSPARLIDYGKRFAGIPYSFSFDQISTNYLDKTLFPAYFNYRYGTTYERIKTLVDAKAPEAKMVEAFSYGPVDLGIPKLVVSYHVNEPELPQSWVVDPGDGNYLTGNQFVVRGYALPGNFYFGQFSSDGFTMPLTIPYSTWLSKVEISFDNGKNWREAGGLGFWSYDWNVEEDGTYLIKTRATDIFGFTETSTEKQGSVTTIVVDNTAPVATITAPPAGSSIERNQNIAIEGTASDDHFDHYYFEVGSGENPSTWRKIGSNYYNEVLSGSLGSISGKYLNGEKTIRLNAVDLAGNTNSATLTVNTEGSEGENPHAGYLDETDLCATCHAAHTAPMKRLLTREVSTMSDFCYVCHDGSGSIYNIKTAIDDTKSHHPVKDAKWSAFFDANPQKPTVQCTDCHNPHGYKIPDGDGAYSKKLLAAKNHNGQIEYEGNKFCYACHGEAGTNKVGGNLKSFETSEHNKIAEPPSGTKIRCLGCHTNAHGDENPWLTPKAEEKLCFECHDDISIGSNPKRAVGAKGWNVYKQFNTETNSKHDITSKTGAKVECVSCHGWNVGEGKQALANPDNINERWSGAAAGPPQEYYFTQNDWTGRTKNDKYNSKTGPVITNSGTVKLGGVLDISGTKYNVISADKKVVCYYVTDNQITNIPNRDYLTDGKAGPKDAKVQWNDSYNIFMEVDLGKNSIINGLTSNPSQVPTVRFSDTAKHYNSTNTISGNSNTVLLTTPKEARYVAFNKTVNSGKTTYAEIEILQKLEDANRTGDITSNIYYGNNDYKKLYFDAQTPGGTSIKLQIASTSDNVFRGPDGSTSTYYTVSGQDIWSGHDGKAIRYKAYLGSSNLDLTPELREVKISATSLSGDETAFCLKCHKDTAPVKKHTAEKVIPYTLRFQDIVSSVNTLSYEQNDWSGGSLYEPRNMLLDPSLSDLNVPASQIYPSFGDLNNDGKIDMMVGYNINVSDYYGLSKGAVIGYINKGTNTNPLWQRKYEWDLIAEGTPGRTAPVLGDLNNNGKQDLFIGVNSKVMAYENTGTSDSPKWTRKSSWDINTGYNSYLKPTLGDMNGDGKTDLLAGVNGVSTGWPLFKKIKTILCYKNIGTVNSPVWENVNSRSGSYTGPDSSTEFGIPVLPDNTTGMAIPSVADIDGDGLLELFVGDNTSFLGYKNTGTATSPNYVLNPAGNFMGHQASFADIDNDGDTDMVVGQPGNSIISNAGPIRVYKNDTINANDFFFEKTNKYTTQSNITTSQAGVLKLTNYSNDSNTGYLISTTLKNKGAAYNKLYFTSNVSQYSSVKLQLADASDTRTINGKKVPVFRGPDGSEDTYYTTSGQEIWKGLHEKKQILYKVILANTLKGHTLPTVSNVRITAEIITGKGSVFTGWDKSKYADSAHIKTMTCQKCHNPHASKQKRLLALDNNEQYGITAICLQCHKSGGPAGAVNIQSMVNKPYRHYKNPDSHDSFETIDNVNAKKHVACEDCHNPHNADKENTDTLKGANKGIGGLNLGQETVNNVDNEYELCAKCHIDSKFKRITMDNKPRNGGTGSGTPRLPKMVNYDTEFNPDKNISGHPIYSEPRRTDIPPERFVNGWRSGVKVKCTDCHDQIHGSDNRLFASGIGSTDNAYPRVDGLCYRCHNMYYYMYGGGHYSHMGHGDPAGCTYCHRAHASDFQELFNGPDHYTGCHGGAGCGGDITPIWSRPDKLSGDK